MQKFKPFIPFGIAIIVGLALVAIYFYPQLQGKTVSQLDIISNIAAKQEVVDFRKTEGVTNVFWTNRLFGGMPTTMISIVYDENIFLHLNKLFMLWMPRNSGFLFLYFMGFFILMYTQTKKTWLSLFGALAFALSTYFIIIIEAGHNAKANSIGYVAPLIAGILLTYRGKFITGGILTALFAGLHLMCNHFQITYYVLFLVFFLLLAEFINAFKTKTLPVFGKATVVMFIAAILALGPNLNIFMSVYEYSKHTIREKSELTFNKEQSSGGLDKDYITQWSYSKDETLSLFIPNIKGGVTNTPISEHKEALDKIEPNYRKSIGQSGSYWGEQPFTSGPVYVGAFIFFLFILSLFINRSWQTWSLLAVSILSVLLAWGRHFMPLTDWFIDNFPMYDKFRTVYTILVIPEFVIPFLAIFGLKKIFDNPEILNKKRQYLWYSFALTGGIALLIWLLPGVFFPSFISSVEESHFADYIKQGNISAAQVDIIRNNLETARIAILKTDAIRSFAFIALGTILIWLWTAKRKAIKAEYFIAGLFIILIADLIPVNKRYLNESHFVPKIKMEKPFSPSDADRFILADKAPDFRVLNLAVTTFMDPSTSYFHNSIGGYHAAKLQRYQDLITYKLQNEISEIVACFQSNPTDSSITATLKSQEAINMLNTKYIIYNPKARPLINRFAMGNAWIAREIIIADNADEEMTFLQQSDVSKIAIINKDSQEKIDKFVIQPDTTARVALTEYKPEHLSYSFTSKTPQCVVFSEIYYPDWKVYIDGKESPYFRTNYVLRGMIVPEGEHKIEFKFTPAVYKKGRTISTAFSILFGLILAGWLGLSLKKFFTKPDISKA